MSVQLRHPMTQNPRDVEICEAYWAFANQGGYIKHVKALCVRYDISAPVLFETVAQCHACLDDVICGYCGAPCPIEVPADIPYMRAKEGWCCEVCEHALWRNDNG